MSLTARSLTIVVYGALVLVALVLHIAALNVRAQAQDAPGQPSRLIAEHQSPIRALVVSQDGKHLAAVAHEGEATVWPTANLDEPLHFGPFDGLTWDAWFVPKHDVLWIAGGPDNALRLDLTNGEHRALDLPTMGTVNFVSIAAGSRRLRYVSADNTLREFDLRQDRAVRTVEVFGGFLWHVVGSPDGTRTAVGSQNEVNNRSAPPAKLSVFERNGSVSLSYTFPDMYQKDAHCYRFWDNRTLILCLASRTEHTHQQTDGGRARAQHARPNSGRIKTWRWSVADRSWEVVSEVPLEVDTQIDAMAFDQPRNLIWLVRPTRLPDGVGVQVLAARRKTGAVIFKTEMPVGEKLGNYYAPVAGALAYLTEGKRLVIGTWDGRVRVLDVSAIGTEKEDAPDE